MGGRGQRGMQRATASSMPLWQLLAVVVEGGAGAGAGGGRLGAGLAAAML